MRAPPRSRLLGRRRARLAAALAAGAPLVVRDRPVLGEVFRGGTRFARVIAPDLALEEGTLSLLVSLNRPVADSTWRWRRGMEGQA
ncbi:hypothetical protein AQJ91_29450 [Streptomyces dysideae]|uniref:Uncharacterized protein n=1 Tax=Streptomyces dysideae TaxID=909626 RepID=A0A117RZ34_9ACTN|nr:hypothetical protein AQJ91_29450 [Streptomyces dysideae]